MAVLIKGAKVIKKGTMVKRFDGLTLVALSHRRTSILFSIIEVIE
jgi:hypothetical protein